MRSPEELQSSAAEYYAELLDMPQEQTEQLVQPRMFLGTYAHSEIAVQTLLHKPYDEGVFAVAGMLDRYVSQFSNRYIARTYKDGPSVRDATPSLAAVLPRVLPKNVVTGTVAELMVQAINPEDAPIKPMHVSKRHSELRDEVYKPAFLVTGRAKLGGYSGGLACLMVAALDVKTRPSVEPAVTVSYAGRAMPRYASATAQYEAAKAHAHIIEGIEVRRPIGGLE